jgi:hypothetical protein
MRKLLLLVLSIGWLSTVVAIDDCKLAGFWKPRYGSNNLRCFSEQRGFKWAKHEGRTYGE